MSLKAYTGFRMKQRKFPDVLADLRRASDVLADLAQKRQDTFLATRAAQLLDVYQVSKARGILTEALPQGALSKAFWEMLDRQKKIQETRGRDPDVDFEIKFGMYHAPRDGSYIGCVGAEDSGAVLKAFLGTGVATDFSFWDNTDKPDSLNERQWKKRRDAWHEVLASGALPYFEVKVPEPGFSSNAAIVERLPSFESRVKRVASSLALRDWTRSLDSVGRKVLTTTRGFMDYADNMSTEGTPEFENLRKAQAFVASALERNLTAELLRRCYHPEPKPDGVAGVEPQQDESDLLDL
jgi:hypothetical protein